MSLPFADIATFPVFGGIQVVPRHLGRGDPSILQVDDVAFHAADRHAYAAAYPNDTLASDRARQASRVLKG